MGSIKTQFQFECHIKIHQDYDWEEYMLYTVIQLSEIIEMKHLPETIITWIYSSVNLYITLDFIENNIDKSWSWTCLSCNSNITIDFIKRYIKNWNWQQAKRY